MKGERAMKTFKEVMKDIKSAFDMIDKSNENEKRLEAEWMKETDLMKRHETRKGLEAEWIKAEETTRDLYLTVRLLQNNARIALFHEVMPVLLEVLTKYKGKPYGEKTRAKIAQEVEERTGARAYIGTKYNQDERGIYSTWGYGNTYSITAGTKYNAETKEYSRILIDNKIQVLPLECFEIWYIIPEYFEDIPAAVAEMKELYKKAVEMQKELSEICSAFNKYAVEGIESIYCNKTIYERLMVK